MVGIEVYATGSYDSLFIPAGGFAGIGIGLEARGVAGRDGDTDAMAGTEYQRGRPQVDIKFVNFAGLHKLAGFHGVSVSGTYDTVKDYHAPAVGIEVTELCGEVGIGGGGRGPEFYFDAACDFEVLIEFFGSEEQDIRAIFDGTLVAGAFCYGQVRSADGGDGIAGVIFVRQGDVPVANRFFAKGSILTEIKGHHFGGDGPIASGPPFVAGAVVVGGVAHDVIVDDGYLIGAFAVIFQPGIEPSKGVCGWGRAGIGEDKLIAATVAVWLHDKATFAACADVAFALGEREAVYRTGVEDVVPAAHVHNGDIDAMHYEFGIYRTPEVVVVGVVTDYFEAAGIEPVSIEPVLDERFAKGPALIHRLVVHA